MKKKSIVILSLLSLWILSACSVVPISGRRQLNLVPDNQILSSSLLQYRQFIAQAPLANNTAQGTRVRNVGSRIAQATMTYLKQNNYTQMASQLQWEFNLVQSNQVNAFCMPGGKIVVYTGLLGLCSSDEELASVVAHEVSHAIAKHSNERLSRNMVSQLGGQILLSSVGGQGQAMQAIIGQAYGLGSSLFVSLPYNRKQEYEADQIGMILMAMAGYNPQAAITLWKKMASRGNPNQSDFFSTHPNDNKRVKALESNLATAMKYYRGGATTTNNNTRNNSQKSNKNNNSNGGFRFEKQ